MESLVGSAAWTNGEEYKDEYSSRIHQFSKHINKEALVDFASSLRDHQPCTLSDKFSVGNFNLVLKIEFADGVEWVARLRMPPMPGSSSTLVDEKKKVLREMESELATMEFVRYVFTNGHGHTLVHCTEPVYSQKTNIPIPRVYGYDFNENNPIGCPFSIMEYIHGNTAEEISHSYPGDHEGIPAEFEEKFWRQLAQYMITLAAVRLPQIGSITRVESGSFVVGPLIETDSGPYTSAEEFYAEYPLALSRTIGEDSVPGQSGLVEEFQAMAKSFGAQDSQKGFGLAHYDLNANNILVDRSFNILAIIDWDSVVAVPDAALYRVPYLLGMDCPVPGVIETHPAVMKRLRLCQRFTAVVEEVGREKDDCKGPILTREGFFSKEAVAFRSLLAVKMRQDWVNYEWMQGLRWLRDHSEADVAEFYMAR